MSDKYFVPILFLILNIIGAVWLGIKLDHFILIPLAYIILFVIVGNTAGINGVTITFCIGAAIPLILVIITIISVIKGKMKEKRLEMEAKEQQQINNDLLEAVKSGDAQAVQELLEYGADANYSNSIKIAVENGNKEIVELLLEKGAKVNFILDGKSLLDMASDKEIIRILKKNGAKTKSEIDEERAEQYELDLALCNAVANKDIETAMSLISKGADANFRYYGDSSHIHKLPSNIVDFPNMTISFIPILFLAIKNNDIKMITYLRAKGADVLFDVPCLYWSDYFAKVRTHINAIDLARDIYKNEKLVRFLENGE